MIPTTQRAHSEKSHAATRLKNLFSPARHFGIDVLQLPPETLAALNDVVGYLNFSSGSSNPAFLRHLNAVWAWLAASGQTDRPWHSFAELLLRHMKAVEGTGAAFQNLEQAREVIRLTCDELLPAYRRFHTDLLFHQSDAALFQPFFLGRAFEAVLAEGPPWNETSRVVNGALRRLNSFVGHRPVPQLHGRAPGAPYEHEWTCPLPIYVRGAGTAVGPYQEVTEHALAILRATPASLLEEAGLDLDRLEELAVDMRAYDFDHPADKRPNYQFGQWDPHSISREGYYQRLVVRQLALELLLARPREAPPEQRAEFMIEAGAVLAGTMLMAAGVDGPGPGAHDSGTTLATLLPRIASYRDRFYEQLLSAMPGQHGARLRAEAQRLHQPLGGARQTFNQRLARVRALQVQHVHLAMLFARMGYPEAANRQAQRVATASARFLCQIHCRLTAGHHALDRGELGVAAVLAGEIEELLRRGIECGALADPWTILGFQAQYSLFPAVENSMYDYRVDALLEVVERLFALRGRILREAAAGGVGEIELRQAAELERLAHWWDQFATIEVGGVLHVGGGEAATSARQVARALSSWREAGAASGAIAFWRRQVDVFDSPKAYALVVEALLDRGDAEAAQALLMQWLSQRAQVPLARGSHSFYELALRWMRDAFQRTRRVGQGEHGGGSDRVAPACRPGQDVPSPAARQGSRLGSNAVGTNAVGSNALEGCELVQAPSECLEVWQKCARFMDFVEANAEDYWVPTEDVLGWRPQRERTVEPAEPENEVGEEGPDDVVAAAYEGMVYRDTTDDGTDAPLMDEESPFFGMADFEQSPVLDYLALMTMMSQLWKLAARAALAAGQTQGNHRLLDWYRQAQTNLVALRQVQRAIENRRLPATGASWDALVEYDRQRQIRDWHLSRVIMAQVETAEAARLLRALYGQPGADDGSGKHAEEAANGPNVPGEGDAAAGTEWPLWAQALGALVTGNVLWFKENWLDLLKELDDTQILYVSLARGGRAEEVFHSQNVLRGMITLLRGLPRLGLLREAGQLLLVARSMERHRPQGSAAVSEFNRLFDAGFVAIIEAMLAASGPEKGAPLAEAELVQGVQRLMHDLASLWQVQSRSMWLSVLEHVLDAASWKALRQFICEYGADLFTPKLMQHANLRAILQQGVERWLRRIEEEGDGEWDFKLLYALDREVPREKAVEHLRLVFEAVVDNYVEYRDYKGTTTQSDRGELLYMFLDFLRIKARYERVAWNLRPAVLAHKVLCRHGHLEAAELWRQLVGQHTQEMADRFVQQLDKLSQKYGLRLSTVADRIHERFLRPLVVDRVRMLVRPAMQEARGSGPHLAFAALEEELTELAEQPSGSGLDVPEWLESLEEEAEQQTLGDDEEATMVDLLEQLPVRRLTWEEIHEQLAKFGRDIER